MSQEMSKTYNCYIFPTLSRICTSHPPKFWSKSKFDHTLLFVYYYPYLDWAFANLERLRGPRCSPFPHNLAISSQMTVKLCKEVLSVEIFTNRLKDFDDVIVMLIL